jgi:hemolysin III
MTAPDLPEILKPRMRGVLHAYAFFAALGAGAMLVAAAEGGSERVAALIYALGLAGLLGTSALYHRVTWSSERTRMWMRRLDHSMIFVLIAATATPVALLVLDDPLRTVLSRSAGAARAPGSCSRCCGPVRRSGSTPSPTSASAGRASSPCRTSPPRTCRR